MSNESGYFQQAKQSAYKQDNILKVIKQTLTVEETLQMFADFVSENVNDPTVKDFLFAVHMEYD